MEAERNRRLQVFRQSYESLVSLVCLLVHYLEFRSGSVSVFTERSKLVKGALRVLRLLFSQGAKCYKLFAQVKQGVANTQSTITEI